MALGRDSIISLAVMICIATFTSTCAAQNRGAQNQRGGMGQRAQGQSNFGQSAFGQGGQSGFGGAGVGRGQSRGGAGYGANAFGAGSNTGFGGVPSGQFGNNQFGGGQLGPGGQGNFLGGDAAQTQNFFRAMNGGQRRTAMFDFMIENLNEMRDRGNRGGNSEGTPPVRVKLRPAFETPLSTMAATTSEMHSRLSASLAEQGVADSRISLDGRTMTLEGRVATEHQKELIAKMVSLEPGVTTIDNQLIVDPTILEEE